MHKARLEQSQQYIALGVLPLALNPSLNNLFPVKTRAAHIDHTIARHRSRRGVVNIVRLEDNLAVGRHRNTVAIGQLQRSVVIQHRVQVLDSNGVHGTVEHNPHVIALFGAQCTSPQRREDAVIGGHVEKMPSLVAIAFGFMRISLCGSLQSVIAFMSTWMQHV